MPTETPDYILIYIINITIVVSDYCILLVQAPVTFIVYITKWGNFVI